MATLHLRLTTVPHAVPRPVEDEQEGQRLVGWVRDAVKARRAPPAAVVLRPEKTEILPLAPVAQARVPAPRFLGALTRSTSEDSGLPYAVGVIGVLRARRAGEPKGAPTVPMAVVFLEWGDNRWWYWRAVVDPETGVVLDDSAVIASAVDGDPMPPAFGRWWALARRANLGLHLSRRKDDSEGTAPVVH